MFQKLMKKFCSQFKDAAPSGIDLVSYSPGEDCTEPLADFHVDVRSGDYSFELPIDANHKFEITVPSGHEELAIIFSIDNTDNLIAFNAIWIKGELFALSQMIRPSGKKFKESIEPISKVSENYIEINGIPVKVNYTPNTKSWKVMTC